MNKQDRIKAIHDQIKKNIDTVGWSVMGVGGDGDKLGFSYTIGLSKIDLPELILFSVHPQIAQTLLNDIAFKMKAGEKFELKKPYSGFAANEYLICFIKAVRYKTNEYMNATDYHYPDYKAWQVIWPDKENYFPWESKHDNSLRKLQPLLVRKRKRKK